MKSIQNTAKTLVELSRWRAENQPDKNAFIYLEDGEREAGIFTYKDLDTRAKSIAAKLQSKDLQNERALLIYESGLDYIDSFFGCLYAGVISVPLHLPGKNKSLSRISAIAKDSGAKIILSTKEIRNELENEFAKDDVLKNLEWIDTENVSNDLAPDWMDNGIKEDTLAYLQYTSGSTGIPKGVMVNHRNLITNINIIDKSHPHNDKSVMVTWLPIHHDMGLIYGMLLPFCCGYPCYFMTPQAFVQKPYRWLNAISKYKGTHNAAPNFAFELCVNKITEEQKKTLDLSTWTAAMNAAEPVRYETIDRFVEYFKDCGFELKHFCPGYGLAEGTLILSTTFTDDIPSMKRFDDKEIEKNNFAKPAEENDKDSKVHVGHSNSIEDTRIAIVDPTTLIECKEGEVGEVWSSGISIAQGYWKREDATRETFKAHISDTNEGPFLRTGDLGFIRDNELYITGRHKDLIIIRGQNHYPQDIEYTVEASHPALRLGCVAAFSIEEDGEEHLGIVQEVQKNFLKDLNTEEVVKAIRKAVSEEHDLQVSSISLIKPGTVPKTSSGKIQRRACLQGVMDGTLEVIAEWKHGEILDFRAENLDLKEKESATDGSEKKNKFIAGKNNLKEWLVNRLAELMQIKKESIDINEPFAAYGMDSLKAVQISGDLETLLEKELPATLVYDYPSINLLSAFLTADYADEKNTAAEKITSNIPENEPIAIVGIGLRFPGANNVSEFWNNLKNGKDSIREIPEGRWNKNLMKDSTVTYGGFVDDVDKFDPVFFGISPREAIQIDPQQRFTLEVAWEALEDAGINPETLAGKNAGVFIGICTYDYSRFSSGKKELFDVYTGTGTSLSIAANRISYVYDFRGPSIAIDTACSSSLVALHTACESLRSGQSVIALAGGVNLLLAPDWNVVFTEADMLAPDGHCKTFDVSADGYVRSEGCGIVVLKKLSDAIKDGDRIYSLIKGSALNQDGRSNGLTAPNGPSQEEVIKSALANANVKPSEITYFETHGTGTPLGDPIEVNSLTKVITKDRSPENICYIGSVKTNIGHLEAAAGIAGIIKTSLALYNKEIPPHLNYKKLNPEILIDGTPIKIADKNVKWDGSRRTAGVSSFGFGGTNAHIILGEASESIQNTPTKTKPISLFTLSAKNENVLNELVSRYEIFLEKNNDVKLEDICHTANFGRASHSHRLAIVCSSVEDLKKKLNNLKNKKSSQGIVSGIKKINHFPKTAFLFPGQGAQFIGMGKELYDTIPLFRNIINKCDEILRNYLDKPLLEVLFYEKDEKLNPINETTYTQPALFAIEYALAKLWMSWGIEPSVMMGHSAGEYVAACLAGVFSLEDGLKLVTERGRLMQTMTGDGEMYTIFTDEQSVKKFLNGFSDSVSVASINGPLKTVISGKKEALGKIIPLFDAERIEYKKINVSIASHSPLMNSMIDEFRKVCDTVKYSSPAIPVVSNITGEIVTDKISNPEYWCEHILSTVRFSDGIKACVKYGVEFFIDLGPKPTSISLGQETVQDAGIHWLPSIKYNFTIWETMLQSLGAMYVQGIDIDGNNFDKDYSHKKISLPAYPFQKNRYWIEDSIDKKSKSLFNFTGSENSLHGNRLPSASNNEYIFNAHISGSNPEYLKDHCVFGEIVLPGAAYAEIAMSAFNEVTGKKNITAEDLKFHRAMILKEDENKNIQTILTKEGKNKFKFEIFSAEENGDSISWMLHSSGNLHSGLRDEHESENNTDLKKLKDSFKKEISVREFYDNVKGIGIEYKKEFRGIRKLFMEKERALAEIEIGRDPDNKEYMFHPALLDACFQSAIAMLLKNTGNKDKAFIPVGIERMDVKGKAGIKVWSLVELSHENDKNRKIHSADIKIFSDSGDVLALIKNFRLKEVSREEFISSKEELKDWFYEIVWEENTPEDFNAGEIKDRVEHELPELVRKNNLKEYKKGTDQLEKLCIQYIVNAFINSGFKFEKGKAFTGKDLINELKIIEKHHMLLGRLSEILTEAGILKRSGDTFEIISKQELKDLNKKIESVRKEFPEIKAELTLLSRCGEKLSEVLTGKADPLQLLFPNGDFTDATDLYRGSPAFIVMNESVKNSIAAIADKFSKSKILRILEIGAGTGSTTSYVLPALTETSFEYVFTDISPAFFSGAKDEFKNFKNIEYKVLDIEKDPAAQKFKEKDFDIVIASNVIHATKDLSKSIENIYKLLNNKGVLILNEVTEKKSWIDLTFGLTDGWWRFEDKKLRADYPLLSKGEWKKFIESGKRHAEVSSPGNKDISYTGQSTVVVSACSIDPSEPAQPVIFANEKISNELSGNSGKRKLNYVFVSNGNKFEKLTDSYLNDKYKINFTDKKDFAKLFDDLGQQENTKLIYFAEEHVISNAAGIEEDTLNECMNVLNLLQSVPLRKYKTAPELYLITRDSKAVTDDDKTSGLTLSPLWGMKKVIELEFPELRCKIIDLDKHEHINYALSEIQSGSDEDEVAYRNGKRFISRLKRKSLQQIKEISIDDKSTYLITGGLGGLGILTAKWLADRGAKHLALTGRRGSVKGTEKILEELRSSGVDVKIYKADVTKKEDLEKIIKEISDSKYALKGVIHSAGVLDDGVLLNQSKEKFEKVMAPKIMGAWHLHEITEKLKIDLEFFTMYSSVASLLGSAGQSNHSSANAFLDSLAHYRRNKNLPAQSINWGVWSEIGSAAEKGADKNEKIAGIGIINPKDGVRALEKAMSLDCVQVGVMPIDWKKYSERYNKLFTGRLVSAVKDDDEKVTGAIALEDNKDFITQLVNSPDDKHSELLIKYFQELISGIMGMEPEELEADIPLNMMGLDSLMAIELKNKVNMELGVDLNLVRYMEETNIINLADELKEQLPKIINKKKTVPALQNGNGEISEEDKARELLGNLDNLTEEELDRLLNETK